jgi:FlaA1/EpsC-like NDP-sugar epimerase
MKTLVELYEKELLQQPEDKASLADVMFKAAFVDVDIKKKVKELSRLSEDLLEDFHNAWQKRVEEAIQERLKEDMTPQLIVASVPFLTKEEMRTLMEKLDEFLPGDTEEIFALKISDLHNNVNHFMILASDILKELYTRKMVEKQQSQIIIPDQGLITGLGGGMGNIDFQSEIMKG